MGSSHNAPTLRQVELFLGVANPRDRGWTPPRALPSAVRALRARQWWNLRVAWVPCALPLVYTGLVVAGCWQGTLFIVLTPVPTLAVMVPKLYLSLLVPDVADTAAGLSHAKIILQTHEFFAYAPIRFVATLEACRCRDRALACRVRMASLNHGEGLSRRSRPST